MKTRVLTGITTTGTPHLGNYVGAIRPAIRASQDPNNEAFFFLADYHALIKCEDPDRIARSRIEIAATWLAAGLDPERVVFYRQSDIPEIPELAWMLTCVTAKGLMNRAHAYKASVDQNRVKGEEDDDGVTMGLFSYPILMAADILIFNAQKVPVGRDQVQHLEMARDIAQRFNHLYGGIEPWFVLPEAVVDDDVATLPGLDGRKMSKSYNNTIPLFEGGPKALQSAVARIVTDSRLPGEPKDPESTQLLPIFKAFASSAQIDEFIDDLRQGMAWGDAKQRLAYTIEQELAPLRDMYANLMARPDDIEDALAIGARKAREQAGPLMARLREAVGLRNTITPIAKARSKRKKAARFVTYRDEHGQFRFKLVSSSGVELAVSLPQAEPKQSGVVMRQLQQRQEDVTVESEGADQYVVVIDEQVVAYGLPCQDPVRRDEMMELTREALSEVSDAGQ
ncbi:tryptophan--tRNA ligase [Orrella marina]|uniref:Tryptophan--tRNA ligase n=1 Tax=Orrella marina TaxID=2163011 RepID=A0A2R4XJ76_9BURK|nr:tryptophan--tRNA ligase [Orrella marina]AWB33828.1 tryptophan--tRNA ligase [Orrella marina]